MKNNYIEFNEINKNILNKIKVGDLVKVNDWKQPQRVVALSDTHIITIKKHPTCDYMYSIIEKVESGFTRNEFTEGSFRCGADNYDCACNYCNLNDCKMALLRLRDGLSYCATHTLEISECSIKYGIMELSCRNTVDIDIISFKHTEYNEKNILKWINKIFKKGV